MKKKNIYTGHSNFTKENQIPSNFPHISSKASYVRNFKTEKHVFHFQSVIAHLLINSVANLQSRDGQYKILFYCVCDWLIAQ